MDEFVRQAWQAASKAGLPVFVPSSMVQQVGREASSYSAFSRSSAASQFGPFMILVDKGRKDEVPASLISALAGRSTVEYANEVYVVFRAQSTSEENDHVKSYYANLNEMDNEAIASAEAAKGQSHFALYLGNNVAITETFFGRKIFVDSRDVSLTPHLVYDGKWEWWITTFIRENLAAGETFIDLGANCGYFSILAADIVGEKGHVVSVEPQPVLAGLIRKSFSVNGFSNFSEVVQAGVGDRNEKRNLHLMGDHFGDASLIDTGNSSTATEEISISTLPSILKNIESQRGWKVRPAVIKIDVEGLEMAVWRGARGLLATLSPLTIIMEFFPNRYASIGEDPEDFIRQIQKDGFSICQITHQGTEEPFSSKDVRHLHESNGYADLILRKS